jgi:cobalt-zinc-cadmium efflux system outer membrane protein
MNEGRGDHRVSSPQSGVHFEADGTQIAPHDGVLASHVGHAGAAQLQLSARARPQARTAPGEREGVHAHHGSLHEDLERNLLFSLRSAFVQTLEAKAVLELARADLDYYDKIITISQDRFKAGDLAQIDLDRIELLRVQYESEIETAIVNLRTQKIQLLQLLDDRTPVDQFDVTGPFDFSDA